ncbi:alpha/beta hydrolase [Xanthobacteraceae bacterium Astr-EGSB]|uniref:alpha/beta fold hydrolase n=1 Tax=Astrobacterium formosum TaxID=3069710 RepID=UPI0027B3CBF8|nr:alpha/beta hydrolase [Xanthobacteraceae bacterium Astr-EGSB]
MTPASSVTTAGDGFASCFISAPDGLRLHARLYGGPVAAAMPVVCLPGLARTSADFHEIASALAGDATCPRRVVAIDSRGRGRSQYDRDPGNYTLATELADVIAVLTALDIGPAVFIGTSRGGLLTMLMAAARPTLLAGAVLNDIGPAIEAEGLARIKSYVGRLPAPRDFADAAAILRRLGGHQFPGFSDADWQIQAQRTWKTADGGLVLDYDPKLSETLASFDPTQPPPPQWALFDALAGVPVMVIRGANSDILAAETLAAMAARRPDLVRLDVPDQGHAPALRDDATVRAVAAFVQRCRPAAAAGGHPAFS